MNKMEKLTINQVLRYECDSNWLAPHIGFEWGQKLMGWYIAIKVKIKYKRYLHYIKTKELIKSHIQNT